MEMGSNKGEIDKNKPKKLRQGKEEGRGNDKANEMDSEIVIGKKQKTDHNRKLQRQTNSNIKDKSKKNKQTNIATWNVKTLLKIGKMEEVAKEIIRYNIELAAIQEVRWEDSGEIKKDHYSFFYSGEKQTGKNGVGFYVQNKLLPTITEFKPVNGRIATLRIKKGKHSITVVNIYAPTEPTDAKEKDEFYGELEKTCEEIPKMDEIIVMGDLNAQLGEEEYLREVVGKSNGTIHKKTNDNGHRICQLAGSLNMVFLTTRFEHPRKHKVTWRHPNGAIENQIDHILATKGIMEKTIDTRSYRGANADTDHYLVMAKLRNLKLSKRFKKKQKVGWNIDKLSTDDIRNKYDETITKKIQAQKERRTDIEGHWNQLKQIITDTADEVLGDRSNYENSKEWFCQVCESARIKKNVTRMKWINTKAESHRKEYKTARNNAHATYKKKKNEWLNKKLEEIEHDRCNHKLKQFYKKIKTFNAKGTPKVRGMRDNEGRIEHDPIKIGKIWQEHFNKSLNQQNKNDEVNEESEEENAEEEQGEPGESLRCPNAKEIQKEINRARNGKAAGEDKIVAELIKYGGKQLHEQLQELVKQIWDKEEIPGEWTTGIITPIHKKGNREKCSNYRAITLLNTAYKIVANLVNHQLKAHAENIIGDYQNGFRPGRSTINAIHTVEQIIQKYREYNKNLHITFIDFRGAFDTIDRSKMRRALKKLAIPNKLIKLQQLCLQNSKAKIKFQGTISDEVNINRGVKQGDPISPTLFNLVLEHVLREAKLNGKDIILNGTQIIAYADDLTVVAEKREDLIKAINKLDREAKKVGLEINENKTKYMKLNGEVGRGLIITGKYKFEEVTKFNYLGVTIGKSSKDRIQERIQKGNQAFGRNKQLLRSKNISKQTKIKMYKTLIRPVITYATETTTLTKKDEEDLRIVERKIMRSILGPQRTIDGETKMRTNKEIEQEMGGENIARYIKSRRLEWAGHIMRRAPTEMIKRITNWTPLGPRSRGRPRKRWRNQIEEDIKIMKIKDWKTRCRNRKDWKYITNAAKTHTDL